MKKDSSGAYIMRLGDIVDYNIDPNLTSGFFQLTRDGDGDDSTLVKLTGFGVTDPTVVKAKMGALIRQVPVDMPGADPDPADVKAFKRSWVRTVNQNGEKITLGQWPEGAPGAPDATQ